MRERRCVPDGLPGETTVTRLGTFLLWRRARVPGARAVRIGLIGPKRAGGLGYQNRDIARHLEVCSWLVAEAGGRTQPRGEYLSVRRQMAFLHSLDWILFAENPCIAGMVEIASKLGVQVACVPNWEFTSPHLPWIRHVTLMICPTMLCFRHLSDWKQRYGFHWRTVYVPWPVDSQKFKFRPRYRCGRFLFVNGAGGGRARRIDERLTTYRRKGGNLIVEAARIAPELKFLVYSQRGALPRSGPNIEFRGAPRDNCRLYLDGDVCVQPSHWEGIGLQLLECQAAGLPLVTTDAPPMNEYHPLRTIPVTGHELVRLTDQPFVSPLMTAQSLVDVLRSIHNSDVAEASQQARAFIEREHSWEVAKRTILDAMRC